MRLQIPVCLIAAALMAASARTDAHASVITGINSSSLPGGTSTGSIGPVGVTPAPNNDGSAAPSPNLITYSIFANAPGVMDVEFNVADSGGTTEYRLAQSLINITGEAWSTYHFELGFGTGASFVRSSLSDFLSFDKPSSAAFGTLLQQADTLDWSNGLVASIGVAAFMLAIDVPDHLQAFNPYGQSRFTLRQVANAPATEPSPVPEPTSMALLGSGLLGLAARMRKRRATA